MIFSKKANLSNSIYQRNGSDFGLTVKNGMLINNAPDGQTGIAQAAQVRKAMKRAEKESVIVNAIVQGQAIGKMTGGRMD